MASRNAVAVDIRVVVLEEQKSVKHRIDRRDYPEKVLQIGDRGSVNADDDQSEVKEKRLAVLRVSEVGGRKGLGTVGRRKTNLAIVVDSWSPCRHVNSIHTEK